MPFISRYDDPGGYWAGRPVLVTGATGFIGGHLTRWLHGAGAEVTVLVRDLATIPATEFRAISGNLAEPSIVDKIAAAAPDTIFHLAAEGVGSPMMSLARCVEGNVLGTAHVLEAAKLARIARLVTVGTCYEYAADIMPVTEATPMRPLNHYAATKRAGIEMALLSHRLHDLPLSVVYPFAGFGPGQSRLQLLPQVVRGALDGTRIALTGGAQIRDYLFIDDIVGGLILAATAPAAVGQTVNLASGQPTSLRQLVERMLAGAGIDAEIGWGDLPYRAREVMALWGSNSKAAELLGWSPRWALDEALKLTFAWFRDQV